MHVRGGRQSVVVVRVSGIAPGQTHHIAFKRHEKADQCQIGLLGADLECVGEDGPEIVWGQVEVGENSLRRWLKRQRRSDEQRDRREATGETSESVTSLWQET